MYTPKTKKLLTQNKKLEKTSKNTKWKMYGLNLSPSNIEGSGFNTCKHAGFCKEVCIVKTGLNVMTAAQKSRIDKTRWLFYDQKGFLTHLHKEIGNLYDKHENNLLIRLNILSDIPWERIDPTLFSKYPNAQFIDYTKYIDRACDSKFDKKWPVNYELTYSWNEKSHSHKRKINKLLMSGGRINVVWHHRYKYNDLQRNQLPENFTIATKTHEVVDGDLDDARLEEGKVVMVRAKLAKTKIPHYVKKGFILERSKV